jgi:pimeloyl-ACP methyl ester carboxylesterase
MASSSRSPSRRRNALVKTVTSSDGCSICADAVGSPSKPCLVFIHGYTLSAAVWDDIFSEPHYTEQFFLVCLSFYSSSIMLK